MSERPDGGRRRLPRPCLCLVTDRRRCRGRDLAEMVSLAVEGGVNLVQLREKDLPGGELYDLALSLRRAIRGRALFTVNERLDVALAAGADGVHLPEQGLATEVARRLAGGGLLVGRSVHGVEAALQAERKGADFVQLGTIFATASKPGAKPGGLALVRAVREAVALPLLAIGGITAGNAAAVIGAGADGVAVVSAVTEADDPRAAAADLWRSVSGAWAERAVEVGT